MHGLAGSSGSEGTNLALAEAEGNTSTATKLKAISFFPVWPGRKTSNAGTRKNVRRASPGTEE